MDNIKFEILINADYGGFSIPNEIVLWLNENKGWELPTRNGEDNSKFYCMYSGDESYLKDCSIKSRSNPELIEAYKICKSKWARTVKTFSDEYYCQMRKLRLVEVEVNFEVEDYYDGKERIVSHIREELSDFEKDLQNEQRNTKRN